MKVERWDWAMSWESDLRQVFLNPSSYIYCMFWLFYQDYDIVYTETPLKQTFTSENETHDCFLLPSFEKPNT